MTTTLQADTILVRKACPPGACVCDLDHLLNDPQGDKRILRLTRIEEKKLIDHINTITTFSELQKLKERLLTQLGVDLQITQRSREVRSVRGISVEVKEHIGLCRKTRHAITTAIRRCLDQNSSIIFAILDANDLFGSD